MMKLITITSLFLLLSLSLLLLSSSSNLFVAAVSVADLELTPENCLFIRNNVALVGFIPCGCRLNTGNVQATACFPNCCPKTADFEGDRCHVENRLDWSAYEQTVCIQSPPDESLDDTPNCFDKGNDPVVTSATTSGSSTTLAFELSLRASHQCDDLFITECDVGHTRPGMQGFRINTTDSPPKHCWLPCAPPPISPCTSTSCVYNRGYTAAVVRDWTLPTALPAGDYALVCKTLMELVFDKNTLYQYAYAQTAFKIV